MRSARSSIIPVAVLALALCACSPTTSSTPTTTVGTPSGTPAASPSATGSTTPSPNVTCNNLSFYLDPALGSSATCATIPADPTAIIEPHPEYTQVTIQGYPLLGTFFEAQINVFPIADYTAIFPSMVPLAVTDLGAYAGGGPAPVFTAAFAAPLPFLPIFNAAQAFFSHYSAVPFGSGTGIRFLAEYAQYTVPVSNADLFYTFQGVTSDGMYWVSAILPINHSTLPVDADAGFGSLSQADFAAAYDTYILTEVGALDSQPSTSFTPTIDALDALVSSIVVGP